MAKKELNKWKLGIWIVTSIVLLGTYFAIANFLGNQDNHHTNFRYLSWKSGKSPSDYKWCLHLMMVDDDLKDKMKGKPMDQLRMWLPATWPAKPGSWQSGWLSTMPSKPGQTFEVIADSGLAVELHDGKFERVFPMKG